MLMSIMNFFNSSIADLSVSDVFIIVLFIFSLIITIVCSLIIASMRIKKINVELEKNRNIQIVNEKIIQNRLDLIVNKLNLTKPSSSTLNVSDKDIVANLQNSAIKQAVNKEYNNLAISEESTTNEASEQTYNNKFAISNDDENINPAIENVDTPVTNNFPVVITTESTMDVVEESNQTTIASEAEHIEATENLVKEIIIDNENNSVPSAVISSNYDVVINTLPVVESAATKEILPLTVPINNEIKEVENTNLNTTVESATKHYLKAGEQASATNNLVIHINDTDTEDDEDYYYVKEVNSSRSKKAKYNKQSRYNNDEDIVEDENYTDYEKISNNTAENATLAQKNLIQRVEQNNPYSQSQGYKDIINKYKSSKASLNKYMSVNKWSSNSNNKQQSIYTRNPVNTTLLENKYNKNNSTLKEKNMPYMLYNNQQPNAYGNSYGSYNSYQPTNNYAASTYGSNSSYAQSPYISSSNNNNYANTDKSPYTSNNYSGYNNNYSSSNNYNQQSLNNIKQKILHENSYYNDILSKRYNNSQVIDAQHYTKSYNSPEARNTGYSSTNYSLQQQNSMLPNNTQYMGSKQPNVNYNANTQASFSSVPNAPIANSQFSNNPFKQTNNNRTTINMSEQLPSYNKPQNVLPVVNSRFTSPRINNTRSTDTNSPSEFTSFSDNQAKQQVTPVRRNQTLRKPNLVRATTASKTASPATSSRFAAKVAAISTPNNNFSNNRPYSFKR